MAAISITKNKWFWNSKEIIIRSSKPPVVKRDPQKSCSVGIGIQIKQEWQVSYCCQNAIENKLFFHLHISFFPHTWHVYSHSIILFQRFLGIPLNEFGLFYIHDLLNIPLLTQQLWIDIKVFFGTEN